MFVDALDFPIAFVDGLAAVVAFVGVLAFWPPSGDRTAVFGTAGAALSVDAVVTAIVVAVAA